MTEEDRAGCRSGPEDGIFMSRMTFLNARLRASPGALPWLPRAAAVPGRRRRGVLFAHEAGQLLRLAGPIVVSQLAAIGMNLTDTLMVAPLGPEALAGVAVAVSFHIVTIVLCTGTVLGMGPLVSQAFGAGDRAECRRVLVQGLWVAALLALPITAVTAAGRTLAHLLGQAPAVADGAGDYLLALAPGMAPTLFFVAFRQYLEGMGITRVAMVLSFLGLAVNALADWALIYGVPGVVAPMGVMGAALATSLVRWCMLAALVFYVARRADLTPFGRESLRPVWARIRRIVSIGVPVGATMAAEVGIFALAAVMMGWLGAVQLAAHQVTMNLASGTFMVGAGASLAGSIRVGHHIGAGSPRALRRAVLATYGLSLGFMALCALLFLAAPEALIGLFTSDPGVVRYGTALLLMAALFQVFDGAQVTGLLVLRGAADTRAPMLLTVVGYWAVGLPVAYLLGFHTPLQHVGIWTGLVASLVVVSILLALRVRRVIWQRPLAYSVALPPRAEPAEPALAMGD